MAVRNRRIIKNYWEENIERFAGFYGKQSGEDIIAPSFISFIYRNLIFPIERKFMVDRYNIVSSYIEKNVRDGMKVADVGCGSGIFTGQMASKEAKVYAIDYNESALSLTKKNLSIDQLKYVEFLKLDIVDEHIPTVDLVISIGVLPYINDIDKYFDNILPFTSLFLFNFLEHNHPLNKLRRKIPVLDVRNYSYHSFQEIRRKIEDKKFGIISIEKLATGFVVESKRTSFY